MAPTYTVMVPAPKGHTGSVPVKINGSVTVTNKEGKEVEDRVAYAMDIPYDKEVQDVPEAVARMLVNQYEGTIVKPTLPDPRAKEAAAAPAPPVAPAIAPHAVEMQQTPPPAAQPAEVVEEAAKAAETASEGQ